MARLSVEENGWDLPDELKNQRILLVQMEKVVTESMERTSANKDDDVAKFVRLRNFSLFWTMLFLVLTDL